MKKNLLLAVFVCSVCAALHAQKWVSTAPELRNVLIEEFTGVHCGNCPQGHKITQNLLTANPGRVFAIGIHSGFFAIPGLGYPDLRTPIGDSIAKLAHSTPSASASRTHLPWGMGVDDMAKKVAVLLKETSRVNVAVRASVDFETRTITTEVEVYYTDDYSGAVNYLTVALTQNEILGGQADYGNYNPGNWKDGYYRHRHVLRQYITPGVYGEAINNTAKGSYIYRKYSTKIPENYNGIEAYLFDMSVVAFVTSKSNGSNIMSADESPVTYKPNSTDLSFRNIMDRNYTFCFYAINPKTQVTNNMDIPVTSFEAVLDLNGQQYTHTFNGMLAKGEKTTLDWGTLPFLPEGDFTIRFTGFKNINGNTLNDVLESNNEIIYKSIGFRYKAFSKIAADFETGIPPHMAIYHDFHKHAQWIKSNTHQYGNLGSEGAVVFYLHDSLMVQNRPGIIMTGEVDLTQSVNPGIGFSYAYSDGGMGGTAPKIEISVSYDCGTSWYKVRSLMAEETGQPTAAGLLYEPKPGEYRCIKTTLNSYKGKRMLFRITVTAGTSGNALFIDDININEFELLSLHEESKNKPELVFFPNPASHSGKLTYELNTAGDVSIRIYNALMQLVYESDRTAMSPGKYEEEIDLSAYGSGVYFIQLNSANESVIDKFVKE